MITHLIYMCFFCWRILFSHAADYTPVCTTELGRVAQLAPEFEKRGVKMTALSIDSPESHNGWIKDIKGLLTEREVCTVKYQIEVFSMNRATKERGPRKKQTSDI